MCRPECVYTGSDHPLDADPGWVDLLGELVDSLSGVLICVRVYIGLYSRERDCEHTQRTKECESVCLFCIP